MTTATPGTKLLGTIDNLFSGQSSGAPALETGNRLRVLSKVLQKGSRQLKRLKALVASGEDALSRSQASSIGASIAALEDELPDLVSSVRALAIDVSALGRFDTVNPEFQLRVEEQEQAASKWEMEVSQVIEQLRTSTQVRA